MQTQLHPLALLREAERCVKLARLSAADQDHKQAARYARMADELKRRAN